MKQSELRQLIREEVHKIISESSKNKNRKYTFESFLNEGSDGGWKGTYIYRKEDKKEFAVTDFKNYGSYQELFAKAKDGEEVEVTLGHPRSNNDFFQNWQTGKP